MSAIRTATRTRGMRAMGRVMRELERMGEDRGELINAIGQTLAESAVRRLSDTNVGPDGTPWPVSRRAQAMGGKTQFDSGAAGLAGSITYRALPNAVEVGSPLVHAAQRQFGGTIRPKKGKFLVFDSIDETGAPIKIFAREVTQPARPYLGVSDEDAEEIGDLSLAMINAVLDEGRGGEAGP